MNAELWAINTQKLYNEERGDNVIAGVAISAEDAEAFAADVERLAVEKYGGATFADLLDGDHGDESMSASRQRSDAKRKAALLAEAERAMSAGMPKGTRRRPMPSIEGKTYEQVEEEYARAKERWDELQANPDDYSYDEARECLLDFVDAGLFVGMAMRRHYESLDPQAQSETLKKLAKDEGVPASCWFDVLLDNRPFPEE